MAKKVKKGKAGTGNDKNNDRKLFAFLAVFLSIVGFIIALLAKKEDKYVMFYAKQSLVLFIAIIAVSIIDWVLVFIPIIGWIAIVILNIILVILWIMSWIYALSGEEKEIPIVGKYARSINL